MGKEWLPILPRKSPQNRCHGEYKEPLSQVGKTDTYLIWGRIAEQYRTQKNSWFLRGATVIRYFTEGKMTGKERCMPNNNKELRKSHSMAYGTNYTLGKINYFEGLDFCLVWLEFVWVENKGTWPLRKRSFCMYRAQSYDKSPHWVRVSEGIQLGGGTWGSQGSRREWSSGNTERLTKPSEEQSGGFQFCMSRTVSKCAWWWCSAGLRLTGN